MVKISSIFLNDIKDDLARMSPEARAQQDNVHKHVGLLIATWANAESLFLALFCMVAKTTIENAKVMYFQHESTSARQRLIENLVKTNLKGSDRATALDIKNRFVELSRVRNEFAHCEYVIDPKTFCYTYTVSSKIKNLDSSPIDAKKPLDQSRLNEIIKTKDELIALNKDLLRFLSALDKRSEPH